MGYKVIKFNIYNFMEILSFFFNTMFDSIKVLRKKNNIKKIYFLIIYVIIIENIKGNQI